MFRVAQNIAVQLNQRQWNAPGIVGFVARFHRLATAALISPNKGLPVRENRGCQAAMNGGPDLVVGRTFSSGNKSADNQRRAKPEESENFEEQTTHVHRSCLSR